MVPFKPSPFVRAFLIIAGCLVVGYLTGAFDIIVDPVAF